jgi:CheY-like chemotaxis protein
MEFAALQNRQRVINFQRWNLKDRLMKRVLLVDDDFAMLFAFKKLCMAFDITVETADTLESALQMLSHDQFDILISDLSLTGSFGQEGLEIVDAAKRCNPHIRTFIWTAFDEQIAHDKALATGIEGLLIKPVKFDELLSVINSDSTA